MGMGGPKPNPPPLGFIVPILLLVVIMVIVYYVLKKRKEKRGRAKVRAYEMGVNNIKVDDSNSRASQNIHSTVYETGTNVEDVEIVETPLLAKTSNKDWKKDGVTLKVENLSKNYGNHLAVDNISFEVHKGETIGLVGPNGAGKTTTIKMIAKLLKPTNGRILLRNKHGGLQDINKSSRNLLKFGFLIDIPAFYVKMTAYQVLKYCALLDNYPRDKIDGRIDELLKLFKLYDWKHEKIGTFSKGMTQKLGIIQAIIHDPNIVIMDEPQTGLDPKARIEIRKFIREIQKQGKTIFIASHMLYEISEVCDKIALINHGKIVAFDSIDNLEKSLKTKELNCVLLEPIDSSSLEGVLNKLIEKLEPYLDRELDPEISDIPIKYYPEKKELKLFYDGKEESRGQILKILIKDFESEFTIISYTQPKTSQLERIYSEMITDYEAIKITKPSEQEV